MRPFDLFIYLFGKQFTNPQAGFTKKKKNERLKCCDVELLVVYSLYLY